MAILNESQITQFLVSVIGHRWEARFVLVISAVPGKWSYLVLSGLIWMQAEVADKIDELVKPVPVQLNPTDVTR